jgi:PAS domain S-box-containing protein
MEDASQERVGTVCIVRDVSERKKSEGAIRESEERYRAVVEQTSEGIYLAEAHSRRFVDANAAFQKMVGYTLQELEKMTIYDIIAHDRESIDRNIERIMRQGSCFIGERQYTCKDGSCIDVEISINLISHSGRNVLCAAVHDITDRKRAQERITRQLQRLAALRNIDMAISASVDLRVTLSVIVDQVTTQLGVDASSVLLLNKHGQVLEYGAGRGFRTDTIMKTRLRVGEGYAGRAALERRTVALSSQPKGQSLAQMARGANQTVELSPWTLEPGPEDSAFLRTRLMSDEEFIDYYAVPLVAKGHVKGVLEIFHRSAIQADPDWLAFLEALGGQAAIAVDNATLFDDLERSNFDLALAYDTTLAGWSRALDLRDEETEGHSQRVTEMTLLLAEAMGMSETELVHVRRGALLHDIGKMGIPDSILLKPGALDAEELEVMRRHPDYAYRLLSPIGYLRPSLDIPYCHHEKWDGSGYPRGLKGEEIPLAARIFAVVDVWDALSSDRPYRKAWPHEKVCEHIRSSAGSHFDPKVADVFLQLIATRTQPLSESIIPPVRTAEAMPTIPLNEARWPSGSLSRS